MVESRRVFEANFNVYAVRKVRRQLGRERIAVDRCTVARLLQFVRLHLGRPTQREWPPGNPGRFDQPACSLKRAALSGTRLRVPSGRKAPCAGPDERGA